MPQNRTLEGFCLSCPDPQEVSSMLASLGMTLHFQSEARIFYSAPELPAQYHYRDVQGTEVIYLAGKDSPDPGTRFPLHRSRWWVSCGASDAAFTLVAQAIASRWFIVWLGGQPSTHHSVA